MEEMENEKVKQTTNWSGKEPEFPAATQRCAVLCCSWLLLTRTLLLAAARWSLGSRTVTGRGQGRAVKASPPLPGAPAVTASTGWYCSCWEPLSWASAGRDVFDAYIPKMKTQKMEG